MASQGRIATLHPQDDLFSSGTSAFSIDRSFATAKRVALDDHSWLEIVPGWVSGPQMLFDRMISVVPWREHDRRMFDKVLREPRMTAASRSVDEVPDIAVVAAMRALSRHYGVVYDSLWMNLYRKGEDSTAWHRDQSSCRRLESVVPVLTLGTTRKFQIKPYHGGRSITFKPGSGDLVVMGGRAQQDWLHCVPKEPGVAGARISVNFQSSFQATR
jgi:alkylated DNA repair dioxygenase AlkB